MSTATATQNDDLIILSDNISSTFWEEPVISQDFNDNNSIISFDTPNTDWVETNTPIVSGEANLKQEDNINLDLPIVNNELVSANEPVSTQIWEISNVQEPQLAQEETTTLDNSISNLFWDINFETPATVVSDTTEVDQGEKKVDLFKNEADLVLKDEKTDLFGVSDETTDELMWDMNSILESTIKKLKKRQSWIAQQKSGKTTTINELEAKIKELREQVAYLKKEIVFLDDENIKIDINVWNLESMKIWKQTKIVNKTRAHNTKKLTKQIKPV